MKGFPNAGILFCKITVSSFFGTVIYFKKSTLRQNLLLIHLKISRTATLCLIITNLSKNVVLLLYMNFY